MSMFKRFKRLPALVAAFSLAALAVAALAIADNLVADGDGITPVVNGDVANNDMALGSVPCGQETARTVHLAISRNGSGTNVFKNGAVVTVSRLSPIGGPQAAAVTEATIGATNTITLPSDWSTLTNNTMSSSVTGTVKIKPTAPGAGEATITYRGSGQNSSNATINRDDPMKVTWTAGSCDSTGPVITPDVSGTLGNNGWYTSDVTVSWNVSDPESAISSSSGCGSTTIDTDTAGTTLTCTATSAGGTSSASVTIKRDATKPVINGSATPTANGDGWNNTSVTVSFTCSDTEGSGVSGACGPDATLTDEGRNQSVTGNVSDDAGNSASTTVSGINIDKGKPSVPTATPDKTKVYTDGDGTDWFKDSVSISYSGSTDPGLNDPRNVPDKSGSGVKSYSADDSLGTSGTLNYSGTATDNAGNESLATTGSVKVDADAPTVTLTCPTGAVKLGSSQTAGWTAEDLESGLATAASGSVTLDTSTVGTKTATAVAGTAKDNVGHDSLVATCQYSVVYDWAGFFQPIDNKDAGGNYILNKAKAGSTVPVKFSLGGNQGLNIFFDTTYPKVSTTPCYADPDADLIEEYSTATTSGLKYDSTVNPPVGQYIYNWKTDSKWSGQCRSLIVKLNDGTSHRADFNFFK